MLTSQAQPTLSFNTILIAQEVLVCSDSSGLQGCYMMLIPTSLSLHICPVPDWINHVFIVPEVKVLTAVNHLWTVFPAVKTASVCLRGCFRSQSICVHHKLNFVIPIVQVILIFHVLSINRNTTHLVFYHILYAKGKNIYSSEFRKLWLSCLKKDWSTFLINSLIASYPHNKRMHKDSEIVLLVWWVGIKLKNSLDIHCFPLYPL